MPGLMIVENLSFWLMTGVLDRYPKLRIVFVEPGIHWITSWCGCSTRSGSAVATGCSPA